MTQTQSPSAHVDTSLALVLQRTFNVPVEVVFNAFTQPAIMQQFMGSTPPCNEVYVDLTPGGRYSIAMIGRDGSEVTAFGVYREVVANKRIVCTWQWAGGSVPDDGETLLTLEFNKLGPDKTGLVLTHENFRTAEARDLHAHGWGQCLDRCEKLIA